MNCLLLHKYTCTHVEIKKNSINKALTSFVHDCYKMLYSDPLPLPPGHALIRTPFLQ
jgi:hypothetical protein